MKEGIELIRQFHGKVHKGEYTDDVRYLYRNLVKEEAEEVREAALSCDLEIGMGGASVPGMAALLEESADLVIVLIGQLLANGINPDLLAEAVRRKSEANLTKFGDDGEPILRPEDGKVLKGPNYKPAVIDDLLA